MLSERKTMAGMLDGQEDKNSGEETVGMGMGMGMLAGNGQGRDGEYEDKGR